MGAGKLILCPTPLGNLGDITERTLEALRSADVVCAEDTRVTGKLLAALGVEGKRLERLDEEAITHRADEVVARVLEGETIAFCSDAGMPGVSDPGLRLVAVAREAGASVEVLPGPSAAVTAYVASGFTCPQYYFGGFLPRKKAALTGLFENLKGLPAVLVFYESPNRIATSLAAIAAVFPLRRVCVAREITKLHEEYVVDAAPVVSEEFARRAREGGVKGEIVVVVDAPSGEEARADADAAAQGAAERARELFSQDFTKKEIIRLLVDEYGLARNVAYDIVLDATASMQDSEAESASDQAR